jgi:type IV pilus assembly protein PilN
VIRINLLAGERQDEKRAAILQAGQKMAIGGSAVLVVVSLFMGWRYRAIRQESTRLDTAIADARQETARLRTIIQQVEGFEQQKSRLQQRVALIEQLGNSRSGPVHLLDQISRALPPALWLTELKQTDDTVVIDGEATAPTELPDFVANLEASGYFRKSIDIVSSQVEVTPAPPGQLIKFSIKAEFQQPETVPAS